MENDENKELYEKFLENSQKEKMDKIFLKFKEFQQQAFYSDLQESSKKMIISIDGKSEVSARLKNHKKINYFIILGAKQSNSYEKFLLNVIHSIPLPHQTYSIIYINTLASKNAFNDFMKVTEFLPSNYFLHLDQLYVLQASFMNKAFNWVSFNIITNFIKGKTFHINQFQELAKIIHFDQIELLKLLPQDIKDQLRKKEEHIDILLANKAMKLVTMEDMIIKHSKSEDKEEHLGHQNSVSKSSIIICSVSKPTKHQLEYYKIGQTGGPLPLEMLIYYFNQREDLLDSEGIFRKSVSVDDQNQILAEIQSQNFNFIETVTDPHLIANAMKRFLANLVTPVVPYSVFHKLMQTDNTNISDITVDCIKSLSEMQKMTIQILLQFFREKVIPKQYKNKMSLKNVCIVSGPCLMRSEIPSIKDLIYSQKIIAVMLIIFQQFDKIFGNKKERNQRLRKSANKFNKTYLEERLGMFESTINQQVHQPCQLTPSQVNVIEASRGRFKKNSDKQQNSEKESNNTIKIWYEVSATIKEELQALSPELQSNSESEFYDIPECEEKKGKNIIFIKKEEEKTAKNPEKKKGDEQSIKEGKEEKISEEMQKDSVQKEKNNVESSKMIPKSEIFDEFTQIINLEEADQELLKKYNQSI